MERIDKKFNQKIFTMGLGGAIAGILFIVLSVGMFLIRVKLAVAFLGAKTLLGMPFSDADAAKVGIVVLVAMVALLLGVTLFVVGTAISLLQFSRKKLNQ